MGWLLLLSLSAFIVYYDACRNQIGRVPRIKRFNNSSAFTWAMSVFFLWIIFFPLYFYNRKALIRRAKKHPVNENLALIKSVFILSPILMMVFGGTLFIRNASDSGLQTAQVNIESNYKNIASENDVVRGISVPDFLVDWNAYAGKEVVVSGVLIAQNLNFAFLYDENLGSSTPVDITSLDKSLQRQILKTCSSQCRAKLILKPAIVMGGQGAVVLGIVD